MKKRLQLIVLLTVSIMPPVTASAVTPCLIATVEDFSEFGAFKGRLYSELV